MAAQPQNLERPPPADPERGLPGSGLPEMARPGLNYPEPCRPVLDYPEPCSPEVSVAEKISATRQEVPWSAEAFPAG